MISRMNVNNLKKNKVAVLAIAVVLSFLLKDAIVEFANAFLPRGEVTVSVMADEDGSGRSVMIVQEQNRKELFVFFRDAVVSDGADTGWVFNRGETGVTWTSVSASSTGASLTVNCRRDPDYFFTALKSRWNRSFTYRINDSAPAVVDCYDEESDGELVRIYPFQYDKTRLFFQIVLQVLAALTFYLLIITSFADFEEEPEDCADQRSNHEKQ